MKITSPALALSVAFWAALLTLTVPARAISGPEVEERLQRINATVEALENAVANQRQQITALGEELQKVREELQQARANDAPVAEDLQRLARKIEEVDRKRLADNEQILKVLAELGKSPPPSLARAGTARGTEGSRPDADSEETPSTDETARPPAPTPDKTVGYVVGEKETLSAIVSEFNVEARSKGYQPITVADVMRLNNITDPRRVKAGRKLLLPLVEK